MDKQTRGAKTEKDKSTHVYVMMNKQPNKQKKGKKNSKTGVGRY